MKRTALAALILILLLPVTAFAAPRATGYGSIFLGANMAVDESIDSTIWGDSFTDDLEYDPGIYVGAAFGGDMGVVRLEGEISYRDSDIDKVKEQDGYSSKNISGGVQALAFMANVFFDLTARGPITPYVGGGIGIASLSIDDVDVDGIHYYDSDDEAVFAYQLGAGVAFDMSRNLALDIGYRFFGTSEADFANSSLEYQSHTVMLGLRFTY